MKNHDMVGGNHKCRSYYSSALCQRLDMMNGAHQASYTMIPPTSTFFVCVLYTI